MSYNIKQLAVALFFGGLWCTGIAIVKFESYGLQISELGVATWLAAWLFTRSGRINSARLAIWIIWLLFIASTYAIAERPHDLRTVAYTAIVIFGSISIAASCKEDSKLGQIGYAWFRRVGLLSATFACLQMVTRYPQSLDVRSNPTFPIGPQSGRSFGFQDEASLLAICLIGLLLAEVSLLSSRRTKADSTVRPLHPLWLIVVLGALLATASSSVTTVLPIAAAIIGWKFRHKMLKLKPLLALMTFAFFTLAAAIGPAADRLNSGSSTGSARIRLAGQLGAIEGLIQHPGGFGLGRNDRIGAWASSVAESQGWTLFRVPAGVDSLLIGQVFELGVVFGVFLFALAARSMARLAAYGRHEFASDPFLALAVASLAGAVAAVGYRAFLFGWLWVGLAVQGTHTEKSPEVPLQKARP